MEESVEKVKKCPISWWRRFGYMGFWFFFFKGIAWIIGSILIFTFGPEIFSDIQIFFIGK